MKILKILILLLAAGSLATLNKQDDQVRYWIKIIAKDKFERSVIANSGMAIEGAGDGYVYAVGSFHDLQKWQARGHVLMSFPLEKLLKDFPSEDSPYHNASELSQALQDLHSRFPQITTLTSIGKSTEGRDIWALRVCGQMALADQLPGSIFMGGHHAREHLSVETPLRILENLLARYEAQDATVVALINHRDIHFIPAVNPDGLEWDIASGSYKYWRKNRSHNEDGTFGVDLNRNYGYQWNHGGSSSNPDAETYMGPSAFSEPETRALRDYVDQHANLKVLLSFHTFSKLILYPWGHQDGPIADADDQKVHQVMAQKMAQWNGYTPEQTSELYIASGDITDWSYGTHKIISFTFELDPGGASGAAGFYPGADIINDVVSKNTEPVLYLIEHSENPKNILKSNPSATY
jgi:carboxypeptidase T